MKIVSIGGGPAGLYFSLLMRQAFPETEITVYERNHPDDTFGWGVVFSAETLGHFEQADPETYAAITREFAYWDDIETYYGDTCVRSTGHGFCGMARKRLLQIFHERCRELDVNLVFEKEISSVEDVGDADLILAVDGFNSIIRKQHEQHFKPTIRWGGCRFSWLGTDKPLDAFTFIFKESEHGLFQVHAYPFQPNLSTFIVECHEDTWKRAGLDQATEEQTVEYCEKLFADELAGHKLLVNRSIWRSFPIVTNEKWHHENMVLMGDAAHTAHFSIGSGTKLAMEDAIALVDAFKQNGIDDVPRALAAYQDSRWIDGVKLLKTANTSRMWFENSRRYTKQHPLQFSFNLMTRSKAITWGNLRHRDPELVSRVDQWWAESQAHHAATPGSGDALPHDAYGAPGAQHTTGPDTVAVETERGEITVPATTPPLFAPFNLHGMHLKNRVVVSPMCQYSAVDGVPNDWHMVHLGSRAVGGAALLFTEMTDVSPEGRITYGCAGMWNEDQEHAWKRVVDFVHGNSDSKIGMQLAHAGRKASCNLPWEGDDPLTDGTAWETLGPSAEPFDTGWPTPRAMNRDDMQKVTADFAAAAGHADRAGFDLVELHMAHGYLLSSFISPMSNHRTDEYGGSLENRMRFPLEVFDAVAAVWPKDKPLAVRISATDWLDEDGGLTEDESVEVARMLAEHGCHLVDVSTAGNTPKSVPVYGRMYQVPFAERIKQEVDVAVMAVGAIQGPDHCNTILAAGRTDLCAMARPHLVNPYQVLDAAVSQEHHGHLWPKQYLPAKPRPPRD